MDTNKMTQHEKDLEAQYDKDMELAKDSVIAHFSENEITKLGLSNLASFAMKHVSKLEAAGVIKYTARREEE